MDQSSDADPFTYARAAAAELQSLAGGPLDAAVVLGSGWGDALDVIGSGGPDGGGKDVLFADLPGFPAPTVGGHGGMVRLTTVGQRRVALFAGRVHLYEGHGADRVVHGVRSAVLAGASTVLLTNAAGSINPANGVGAAVLVRDHLNLTGTSPLIGPTPPEPHSVRFVDLTEAYSARLRSLAKEVEPGLGEGVYAALHGPNYETPAEIAMLRTLGADLVGMSTALETIAARHLGAEVGAISLVTNLAAGLGDTPLDHTEVLAAGGDAGERMGRLLRGVLERL
ncbi:MAG: purine-nucleoside phosphorylase [Actinomycetota bacterium]|nr:purine-nucleoside phosphorylase [Actinomycetota bacterium]